MSYETGRGNKRINLQTKLSALNEVGSFYKKPNYSHILLSQM